MRKSCPKCKNNNVIKHGKRRRKCKNCSHTFRVEKRGSKKQILTKMYLLDRSTVRRIGRKQKLSHTEVVRQLQGELKHFPTVLSFLKKIFPAVVIF